MMHDAIRNDSALRASLSTLARPLLDTLRVHGNREWSVLALGYEVACHFTRIPGLLDELAEAGTISYFPTSPDHYQVTVT